MRTYKRPMTGWWRRNPYYLWYMLREASCVFITAYALVLLVGLFRLSQGEASFNQWRQGLSSPFAIGFHAVALVLVLYHSWTWFKVMPKTLPFLRVGPWRIPDKLIISTATASSVVLSAVLLIAVGRFGLWSVR